MVCQVISRKPVLIKYRDMMAVPEGSGFVHDEIIYEIREGHPFNCSAVRESVLWCMYYEWTLPSPPPAYVGVRVKAKAYLFKAEREKVSVAAPFEDMARSSVRTSMNGNRYTQIDFNAAELRMMSVYAFMTGVPTGGSYAWGYSWRVTYGGIPNIQNML